MFTMGVFTPVLTKVLTGNGSRKKKGPLRNESAATECVSYIFCLHLYDDGCSHAAADAQCCEAVVASSSTPTMPL